MKLNATQVKQAKVKDKPYKLSDGLGLFLYVTPAGSKIWRCRYDFKGKEQTLTLGRWPSISLNEAREKNMIRKRLLGEDKDPAQYFKESNSDKVSIVVSGYGDEQFMAVALEWIERKRLSWTLKTFNISDGRLKRYVFPFKGKDGIAFGDRAINEIEPPVVLEMLRAIEATGSNETAHRVRSMMGQIFRYAIATARCQRNPCSDLQGALLPVESKHFAYLKEKDLPDFIRKLENYQGQLVVQQAIRTLMMLMVRTSEMRFAAWPEIEWDKEWWRIPAERMKMKREHLVPLPRQAIEMFRDLQQYTGNYPYIFANMQNPMQPISENAALYAIYRMGYRGKMTGHGFRSTASTILNEHGWRADAIERQLAHVEENKVRKAYNHAEYLDERREMMQWWADYLDGCGLR